MVQATLCFMGTKLPPEKKAHPPPPNFGPCLLWPNGWMDEDATWYGSRPRPRPHCIRRGPSSPLKGHSSPLFSAHVYCGHGRPSQLLLSSCRKGRPRINRARIDRRAQGAARNVVSNSTHQVSSRSFNTFANYVQK